MTVRNPLGWLVDSWSHRPVRPLALLEDFDDDLVLMCGCASGQPCDGSEPADGTDHLLQVAGAG
jgi:hypothetical protein